MATALHSAAAPLVESGTHLADQIAALLQATAIAPLDQTGWIRVTGSDRLRWLSGMVTNAIQTLAPGEGSYNFVLNAQGRIQGDLTAFVPISDSDALLLETSRDQVPALLAHLDRFIIMDDVELADVSDRRTGMLLAGPQAPAILQKFGLASEEPSALQLRSVLWNKNPLDLIHAHSPLVPRFEIWSDAITIATLTAALIEAGATPVAAEALEQLRILEGTPRYGVDIRNTATAHDLPQETAPVGVPHRALHFAKGCYLGQEIVERIRSRGNVHRAFTGFELTGELPAPGTVLTAEGNIKPIGEFTSVASIPLPGRDQPLQLALGYLRREVLPVTAQARGPALEYPGGIATPVALPYAFS